MPGANDPSNPFPAVETQYTIDKDFGGWEKANAEFFDDNTGIITKIISGLNIGRLTMQPPSSDRTPGRSGAAGRVSVRP